MQRIIWIYICSLFIFLALDAIWLIKISPPIYQKYIGTLLAPKPSLVPALLFYLIFIVGLVIFVIAPAIDKHSVMHAAKLAPLFGLVTYATFDLTNQAVLKGWSPMITMIDLAWGVVITTVSSTVIVFILK
ncbi:MAG: DUF2177 family protein [Candidatus Saccharibacteria bacterium]